MQCSNCSKEYPDKTIRCTICGQLLTDMAVLPLSIIEARQRAMLAEIRQRALSANARRRVLLKITTIISIFVLIIMGILIVKRRYYHSSDLIKILPGTSIGDTLVNPRDGASMVWVPAGEFLMGSTNADKYANLDEKPAHNIYLDGFWIYKNDVTVSQYRKFCEATGHEMLKSPPDFRWIDDHPIIFVSWYDANAYANWAGVALPTEAQWEKAARGKDGYIYPWGNMWDKTKCDNIANVVKMNDQDGAKSVGSFPSGASPYGCMDMAGNEWQWCSDWYAIDYYTNSPSCNPTGPETGTKRILRGGSWATPNPEYLRTAFRLGLEPTNRRGAVSFRCIAHPSIL